MLTLIFSLIPLLLVNCGGGPSGPHTPIGGIGSGSTKPYHCRGSWHYPQNYYEYDDTGLASWYGPGFHGKPKPYGEAFDMHGISAAHRTLPLPTVVKVTNLANGKSIKLVVDDRGPFVYANRIIDLSVGAAKALGTYSKGLATVRVQSLPGESRALSDYLAAHCDKKCKMKDGRTWQQVYVQEIAGKFDGNITHQPSPRLSRVKQPDSLEQLVDQASTEEYLIDLGRAYLNKENAEQAIKKLPASWSAKIILIQGLYNIKLGPFKNIEAAHAVLQHCKEKGFIIAKLRP